VGAEGGRLLGEDRDAVHARLPGLPAPCRTPGHAHGAAAAAPRDEHPAFPRSSPYAACNVGLVPAMGVTYTPAPGYSGSDALTVEEVNVDGKRQMLRIELTVM